MKFKIFYIERNIKPNFIYKGGKKNHDEYINAFIESYMKDSKDMDNKKYHSILNEILNKIKPPYLITIKGFDKIIKEKYPDFNIPKRNLVNHIRTNNKNIKFFCKNILNQIPFANSLNQKNEVLSFTIPDNYSSDLKYFCYSDESMISNFIVNDKPLDTSSINTKFYVRSNYNSRHPYIYLV